jgi:PAS domain S-box-containing protein
MSHRDDSNLVQRILDVTPVLICVYDLLQQRSVFLNPAAAAALGHPQAELIPDAEFLSRAINPDDWPIFLEHLARLGRANDDETVECEYRIRHNSRGWLWFHSCDRVLTRRRDGRVREVLLTAGDITEHKNAEQKALFMAELNRALLPVADPEQTMAVAVRMLGEYLGVDRCGYAEVDVDEDHFIVMGEYVRGPVPNIIGRYRMSGFGENEQRILRGNHAYVVDDIETDTPPGTDLSLYRLGGIRALVCVPLNKDGHAKARMAVHQNTGRHWSQDEISLITDVANRCWEAVERSRAARSLKESEQRYRAFIANSSEAIWRFELEQPIPVTLPDDEQMEMLFRGAYLAECNDVMAQMYGYETASQILGARLADLIIPSHPQNIAFFRALKSAGYRLTDVETQEVDRYGNTKYFLNNLIGIEENGAFVRAWGTQRDVTAQKEAAAAVRTSEERLRRITDATQDALWEIDLKTSRLWWSEGARPLFGHSPAELQIGLEDWYRGIQADDVGRVRPKFEEFMWGEASTWSDEYRFRRADGSYVHIHDQGRKFYDENRVAVRIAGAMVDITERKQAEQEREQLLRQEKAAREEAEAANRMKDAFLATVSHELRTPLTPILGWVAMLKDGSLSQTQIRRAATVIEQSALSQARFVDDLLDTASIINGQFKLETRPVEIEQVLQAALDIIRPSADAKRITMRLLMDDGGATVAGDARRLQQVFWNLLSNAVKFTEEGGGIEVGLKRAGEQIRLTVADTGVGIDPRFMPFIFDRFRQADSSSTRRYGGVGLGLALVRHLVEMHGGSVSASSPGIGQGSTFTVTLPAPLPRPQREDMPALEPDAKAPCGPAQPAEARKLHGVRVLVVEDDPDTLEMLGLIFDRCGAEVITAASTVEALQAMDRDHPDALVSDLAMPDQDGYDLIHQVRSREADRGGRIPAVALSAYTRAEDRIRALSAGFQMHVAKPVNPEELVAVLASLTGIARPRENS